MNYIGSKKSLIPFIKETILDKIEYENKENIVFADLFAGTGIVGAVFREQGFKVISNDIQYYSYVINKHLLQTTDEIGEDLFKHLNDLNGVEGFIYNNYCMGSGSERNYFTDYNGKKCDSIRLEIERLREENLISSETYFYLLASLIESIDKVANTASVYGAFLKTIKKSASKNFKLELLPIINGPKGEVYNMDIIDLLDKIKGDILYLDPPYNGRQYASNYHVLETIAKYDNPILKGKTGLRNYENQKSDFCSKVKVKDAFRQLIEKAKFKHIFLSYNNEGLMSLNEIKELFSEYGEYQVFSTDYKRFKADSDLNRNHNANSTIEYLHYLKKRDN